MKKRTKLMLILLSSAMVAAGAAGLAGCKKDKGASTPTIEETYQSYVAYAEANNKEVLSYDDWLDAILGASKPGPAGPTGPQGPQGEPGTSPDPVTIDNVEIKDGKLVFTLSNGDDMEVDLPDHITHVHTYDENNVKVLIPMKDGGEGLGYFVCQSEGCEHIELVVMKPYDVTVKMGGIPAANIDVVINGATSKTDANGVAHLGDIGTYNDYIISVTTPGYSTARQYRTGLRFGGEIEIEINKSFVDAKDVKGEGNVDYFVEIDGVGEYTVDLETSGSPGYVKATAKELRLYGGETEAKYYQISSDSPYFSLTDKEWNGNELVKAGKLLVIVQPGATEKVYLSGNALALSQAQHVGGENLMYTVKIEEVEPPTAGSSYNPIIVTPNEMLTLPESVEEGGWVYYKWINYARDMTKITMTLDGVEAEFTNKLYSSWKLNNNPSPVAVVSGEDIELVVGDGGQYYVAKEPYLLRVRATGTGEHKFQLNAQYAKGTVANPETLTVKNAPTSFDNSNIWAKLEFNADGQYVIDVGEGNTFKLVEGVPESENPVNADEISGKGVYNLKAGTEYYVRLGCTSVTFREVDPVADAGSCAELPIMLTGDKAPDLSTGTGKITYNGGGDYWQVDVYFGFIASEDGTLTVEGSMNSGSSIFIGDGYLTQKDYKAGDTIVVRLYCSDYSLDMGADCDMPLSWAKKQAPVDPDNPDNPDPDNPDQPDPPTPVAQNHSFKVVDEENNGVANIKVTVNGVEGTTDPDGNVTLSLVPGAYPIALSGYDEDTNYYELPQSTKNGQTTGYTLVLRKDKTTYNFNLKCGGDALTLSGATLKVMNGSNELASVTLTAGKASVALFFPSTVSRLTYSLELTETQKANYSLPNGEMFQFAKGTTEVDVNVVENDSFTVNVKSEEDRAVAGVGVALVFGNKTVAEGVTDGSGRVILKGAPLEGRETYSVQFKNIPSGYRIASGTVSATVKEFSATMLEGNNEATGGNMLNAMAAYESGNRVIVGTNVIANTKSVGGYLFTAGLPGKYKFVANDTDGAAYFSNLFLMESDARSGRDYIKDGKQVYAGHNIVLGAKRNYNKTYEITIELGVGDQVVLGYNTGTDAAGNGKLIVSEQVEAGTSVITSGKNTVNLANGSATAYLSYEFGYEYSFSWTGEATVTVDGEPYTAGTVIETEEDGMFEIVITSTQTSLEFTVTVSEIEGPGGY